MKLTVTRAMIDALDHAADKPDWLIERLAALRSSSEPYILHLKNEESTALEELCAMNIRFNEAGDVLPEYKPLDDLSLLIMDAY